MMVKLARTICMATCLAGLATSAQATLTAREESIVPIAAFAANGNEAALRGALKSGLEKGLSINEIRSILEQMYAYAGFPRSLTGLGVFVDLLQERRQAGIEDVKGREASPMKKGESIREIGTKTQTALIGKPASSPVYDFSPNIDTYLKEHLFGEIFANDLLTWRDRELATIAALAALPAPRQLRSHLNVCLNIGLASDELKSFADIVQKQIGHAADKLARDSVEAVLEARR